MYLTIKEAINEINNNNYSIIYVGGIIELRLVCNNIKAITDDDSICLGELNNPEIKINKHQIMKLVLQENTQIVMELDCFLKIYILKNKSILL